MARDVIFGAADHYIQTTCARCRSYPAKRGECICVGCVADDMDKESARRISQCKSDIERTSEDLINLRAELLRLEAERANIPIQACKE